MKHILTFLTFLSCTILHGQERLVFTELHKQEMHSYGIKQAQRRSSASTSFDILHNTLYLKVDPDIKYIEGDVKAVFNTLEAHDSIGFDLRDELTVDSVTYRGEKIQFLHRNHKLSIFFNVQIPPNTIDSVRMFYKGRPAPDENYFSKENHATGPSIYTLSEPYGAMFWWPCKQGLEDKIDSLDVFVETKAGFKVASNGLLQSVNQLNDTTVVYHWKHRYPIATYLVAFTVSRFEEYSFYAKIKQGTDSVFVQNYIWPQSLDDTLDKIPVVGPMLNLFDSLFGTYPFIKEKYGHAQFAVGGGMEHQTMSFMGDFSYDLISHELAHQWFGDYVTCHGWESLWINEGFATYLNALAYQYLRPSEWKGHLQDQIRYVTLEEGGSIFPLDTLDVSSLFDQRLTYQKASLMIHMVRWNLGDSLFFLGVNNFLNDPNHSYAFGGTNALKSHWEGVSGMDLTEFFEDWFYGEGYPIYDITWGQEEDRISVTMSQTTSHFSVDFFENPVALRFKGETQDTTVVFPVNEQGYFTEFSLPFEVVSVEFDPESWLLAKSNIKFQVTNGFSVFPNPAKDKIKVQVGRSIIKNISVFDTQGNLLISKSNDEMGNHASYEMDLSMLSPSFYYVMCETNQESFVTKVVLH